jgi:hypothetical protein
MHILSCRYKHMGVHRDSKAIHGEPEGAYFEREVLPYAPDAWRGVTRKWADAGGVLTIGSC